MRTFLILVLVLSVSAAFGQKNLYEDDIRALTAAGKVENKSYSNPHAGFVLHLPVAQCQSKLNTATDFSQGYAMLLSCVREGDDGYTLHIQATTWAHYRGLTLEQYVRSVRHLAERDPDMKTIQTETPRKWAGLDFLEDIATLHRSGHLVYVGITCTHLSAYVMCFRGEADTEALARALVMLNHKFEITAAPALQKPSGK